MVAAAADMNVLGLITFSLMLGLALSSLGGCALMASQECVLILRAPTRGFMSRNQPESLAHPPPLCMYASAVQALLPIP